MQFSASHLRMSRMKRQVSSLFQQVSEQLQNDFDSWEEFVNKDSNLCWVFPVVLTRIQADSNPLLQYLIGSLIQNATQIKFICKNLFFNTLGCSAVTM